MLFNLCFSKQDQQPGVRCKLCPTMKKSTSTWRNGVLAVSSRERWLRVSSHFELKDLLNESQFSRFLKFSFSFTTMSIFQTRLTRRGEWYTAKFPISYSIIPFACPQIFPPTNIPLKSRSTRLSVCSPREVLRGS